MIIQTPDRSYQVISRKQQEGVFEVLVCRDLQTEGIENTLIRFFRPEDIRRILERNLLHKEITGNFVDYKESFLWKDSLIMVFVRREGSQLSQWLKKEEIPLSQRLEIGKRLLERLLLLNMPEYLLCGILNPTCILITKALEVTIQYEPDKTFIAGLEQAPEEQLGGCFYQLFALLFQKEEQQQSSRELHDFLEQLRKEPYQDVFHIYQIYDRLMEELMGRGNVNHLPANTWIARWKQRAVRLLALGKRLLVPLAVIAVMIALIYVITHPKQEEAETFMIDQIGTLQIQ